MKKTSKHTYVILEDEVSSCLMNTNAFKQNAWCVVGQQIVAILNTNDDNEAREKFQTYLNNKSKKPTK